MNEQRLDFLDALRGIAVLAVALTHILERLSPEFQVFRFGVFDLGSCGVTVFFLCSGFIIPRSLERGVGRGGLTHFWLKRALRLYPAYWLSVLLAAVLINLGWLESPAGRPVGLVQILVQLTMLQTFVGAPHFLVLYWTLTYELIFYVSTSILYAARVLRRTLALSVSLALLSASLECVILPALGRSVAPGLISFLVIMLSGTLLYRWWSGELRPRLALFGGLLSLGAIIAVALAVGVRDGNPLELLFQVSAWVVGYGVFLGVFLLRKRAMPGWLVWVGQISYSIYLLHPLVIASIPLWLGPATALIWVAVLIPLAWLIYRWIELPAIRLGRVAQR